VLHLSDELEAMVDGAVSRGEVAGLIQVALPALIAWRAARAVGTTTP